MKFYIVIVDCGDPGTPTNGYTVVHSTTLGSVATHTCDDGYVLDGADERECLESGKRTTRKLPPCDGKQCTLTETQIHRSITCR